MNKQVDKRFNTSTIVLVVAVIVAVIAFLNVAVVYFSSQHQQRRPPSLAGQPVPDERFPIDFNKRYNLHLNIDQQVIYNCKILGFSGKETKTDVAKAGISSSRTFYEYFDDWLALELSDGRRGYIPPNSITYIEETETD